MTREHLIQHGAHGIHVAPRRDLLLRRRLLGAHVVRRAEREPGLRHTPAGGGTDRKCNPEVRHHRAAVIHQNIFGLDVAVHHAVPVRVVQRIGHFPGNADRLFHAQLRLAIQLVAERLALDVGHDVKQKPVRRTRVKERQNMRVLQRRGGFNLLQESLSAEHGGELRLEQLERHLAVVLHVLAQIDRRHAAFAELALDAVATGEGGVETIYL